MMVGNGSVVQRESRVRCSVDGVMTDAGDCLTDDAPARAAEQLTPMMMRSDGHGCGRHDDGYGVCDDRGKTRQLSSAGKRRISLINPSTFAATSQRGKRG